MQRKDFGEQLQGVRDENQAAGQRQQRAERREPGGGQHEARGGASADALTARVGEFHARVTWGVLRSFSQSVGTDRPVSDEEDPLRVVWSCAFEAGGRRRELVAEITASEAGGIEFTFRAEGADSEPRRLTIPAQEAVPDRDEANRDRIRAELLDVYHGAMR